MSRVPDNTNLLQQLMDNMTDIIFFKDRNGKFILINEADAKWRGFDTPADVIGKDDFDLFSKDFAQAALQDEQHIFQTGEPMVCKEEKAEWKDGHVKWVSTTKIPLRNENDEIVGCIGIGRDITDLKRKEFELEEANRKLSLANRQIEEDLRMAAQLQKTFLPRTYPGFASGDGTELLRFHHYYQPATVVGGDFCSVYKLNESQAGLLICDVMGHGVRAALVTGIIRGIAEDLALASDSPGSFLTVMNRKLSSLLKAEDEFIFATACYLVIDTETGMLTGALAGHMLPLLVRSRQCEVSPLKDDGMGPALTIIPDHQYKTFSEQLYLGDEVLMYTDGICEAMDAERDEFGVEHLQQTIRDHNQLPLDELLVSIVEAVQNFSRCETLADDICLLGVSLKGLYTPVAYPRASHKSAKQVRPR